MKLYTWKSFSLRVTELAGNRTRKEAYEMTETEHEDTFGERKYSDYDSFRSVQSYYHKRSKLA